MTTIDCAAFTAPMTLGPLAISCGATGRHVNGLSEVDAWIPLYGRSRVGAWGYEATASDRRFEGECGEIRSSCLFGASCALGWRQNAVEVDLAFEAGEEARAGVGRRFARVIEGVLVMGCHPGT
jgi:hypothetical protein